MVTITIDVVLLVVLVSLFLLLPCVTWGWGRITNDAHPMDGVFGSIGVVSGLAFLAYTVIFISVAVYSMVSIR